MSPKALGISALVVAILGIFVPVVTIYVVWFSLALAAIGAFMGDKVFPIVALVANLINLVFLSPLTWMLLFGEDAGGGSFFAITTIIMFISPIGAMIFKATSKETASENA
jgi:hypothetical protein